MKVRILGTGTVVPSTRRASSSYLVSADWGRILVDVGPSVVRRLLDFGYGVTDIDMVVITHFHPDHTVDLATFLFVCNYGEPRRTKPLFLVGGRGMRLFYRKLTRVYPWIVPTAYDLTIKTLSKGLWNLGSISLRPAWMKHRHESIGVRLEEKGRAVVFSGDTDYTPALVGLASRADLLIAECTFPKRHLKGHLNLPTLLSIVRQASPKQVIMSHLDPEWEEFTGPLPAPLLLGKDGMEVDV